MNKPSVSIIIVNYNVKHFLYLTLTSIVRSIEDAEIIVVDNHSSDGSVAYCKDTFPLVLFIENDVNLGFSKANNLGVERATSDLILILNPDVVVSSELFNNARIEMSKSSAVGAVCVQMIDGSGSYLPESKRGLPNIISSLYKITGIYKLFPNSKKLNQYYMAEVSPDAVENIEVLAGACFFIKKSVYKEIGGFDERYFMYGEDIDLSLQIKNKGYEIRYLGYQKMIHFKGESSKKKNWQYHQVFFDAMYLFWKKNRDSHHVIKDILVKTIVEGLKIVSFLKEQLRRIAHPLIDFSSIYLFLYGFTKIWQTNIFGIINYYPPIFLYGILPAYILLWITGLWLAGVYSQPSSFYRNIKGVFSSSVILLISYSLLPENYRYSRAIILAGVLVSIVLPFMMRVILNRKNTKKSLLELMSKGSFSIYPNNQSKDHIISCFHDFTNQQMHYVPWINESNSSAIVIDIETCQMDETIRFIATNSQRKLYYLQSKNFIIDSSDKTKQGKVYAEGEGLSIYQKQNLVTKRILDIVVSVFILFLSPIVIFNKKSLLKNAWQVLINKKTWIGTNSMSIEKSPIYEINLISGDPYHVDFYMRYYTVWYDIDALWRQWS